MTDISKLPRLGNYVLGETLGAGLCEVKIVYDSTTQRPYAAKICKEDISRSRLAKEASIIGALNQARVPNIIDKIDYIEVPEGQKKILRSSDSNRPSFGYKCQGALIMELALRQTMFDYVYAEKGLNEKMARSYFRVIMKSVAAIHNLGFVHRDIKLENILIDERLKVKIADFGFARQFDEAGGDLMADRLGTGFYMAPEIKSAEAYSGTKVDVFACGVLLFMMVFCRNPFKEASATDILYRHFCDERPERYWKRIEKLFNGCEAYDLSFKRLLNGLWAADAGKRFSAQEVLESEWMKKEVYSEEELAVLMGRSMGQGVTSNP